jgi:hypothetical protein
VLPRLPGVLEIGSRARSQPAPPGVVFESLTQPTRPAGRPWLALLDDEHVPDVLEAREPALVVWGSLWDRRPDARVRFDLDGDAGGTLLRWTLLVDEPAPDQALTGHLRKRLNVLVNAELRYSYGQ